MEIPNTVGCRCGLTMLSPPRMIDSITINGAPSMFLKQISGSIEPGKSADVIILNRNIVEIPEKRIGNPGHTRAIKTHFQRRKVFKAGVSRNR